MTAFVRIVLASNFLVGGFFTTAKNMVLLPSLGPIDGRVSHCTAFPKLAVITFSELACALSVSR